MGVFEYILGGALILISVILVIVILFQKERASTGANAFDANNESFYGKNSGRTKTAMMQRLTIILSIVLVVLAIAVNVVVLLNK